MYYVSDMVMNAQHLRGLFDFVWTLPIVINNMLFWNLDKSDFYSAGSLFLFSAVVKLRNSLPKNWEKQHKTKNPNK